MTQLSDDVVAKVARQWFEKTLREIPDWRYRPNWDEVGEQPRQNYRDDVAFILAASGQLEFVATLESIAGHFDMDGYGQDAWKNLALEMAESASRQTGVSLITHHSSLITHHSSFLPRHASRNMLESNHAILRRLS